MKLEFIILLPKLALFVKSHEEVQNILNILNVQPKQLNETCAYIHAMKLEIYHLVTKTSIFVKSHEKSHYIFTPTM